MIADTPRTWPNGPSISTLHVLLLFAGIPLLVILAISLMVLAPGWVRGPRYRPGQPWQARNVWFGTPAVTQPATEAGSGGATAASPTGGEDGDLPGGSPGSGGASAGW